MGTSRRGRAGRPLGRIAAALAVLDLVFGLAIRPAQGQPARAAQDPPAGTRYIDSVFDDVDVTPDVPYRQAVNVDGVLQTLHLDIYEPAGDSADRRPVILFIHGGGFTIGNNKSDTWGAGPTFTKEFARKGFVVVSMQYRLRPELGIIPIPDLATAEGLDLSESQAASLDAYDDAVAAVAWLVDHADQYRIDPRAIIANGPSAGGTTAWHLAWMQGSRLRPEPSGVAAAVSVSGAPFEFTSDTHEPLAAPSPGDRPVIDFHGTADTTIGIELAQQPCSHAAAVGVRCELVPYEGIGHPG